MVAEIYKDAQSRRLWSGGKGLVPVWLKIGYTLYACFLVPAYLQQHGPANFLWFSDIALLMMVLALWFESRLFASMMAVAVFLPELVWNIDFFFRLITGVELFGFNSYMFDSHIPLLIRGLSIFHTVLPALLIWTLHRIGYDKRALIWQTALAAIVLPLSYLTTNRADNVNLVHGLGETPQSLLPAPLFILVLLLLLFFAVYLPTHFVFNQLFHT